MIEIKPTSKFLSEKNMIQLKEIGFIDIYLNPITCVTLLEFRHLTIQELLAAIHIVLQSNLENAKKSMIYNDNLKG